MKHRKRSVNFLSGLVILFKVLMKSRVLKDRLDKVLVERGMVESRQKAQRLIMAGQVRLNGAMALKASQKAGEKDILQVIEGERFVGRGGLKLEAALEQFDISCKDKVCLDIGASTGGFTDCLLQRGAQRVFAVDVGKNQIAWKLRSDKRVRVFDGINARYLDPQIFDSPSEIVTMDVSFISLQKVLPAVYQCVQGAADFIVLIKPQFEAGRQFVERGGVVRDARVHQNVIQKLRAFVEETLGAKWQGVMESPLRGPAGNKEFFAWFRVKKMKNL